MMIFNNRTQLRNLKGGIQASGQRIWISARTEVETTLDPAPGLRGSAPQEYALKTLTDSERESVTAGGDPVADMQKQPIQGAAV